MADHPIPDEVFYLKSEADFEVLSDPTRLEIIEMLYRPHSVGELADAMDVPRTRLYHHVNLLEEHGMIRVVDTRRSGAVDEKLYQVAARSFHPSPEYLKSSVPRERAKALITSIFGSTQADFIRAVDAGTAPLEDDGGSRSVLIFRGITRLDSEQLHQFVSDLEEVYSRYQMDDDAPDDSVPVAVLGLVYQSSRTL